MPNDRFFYGQSLVIDTSIELLDQEFHHLAHVTRTREGERIEIVNGKGQLAEAIVEKLGKKKAVLSVSSVFESPPLAEKIVLIQAIPRMNRLDFIVEKGTELGMTELWLFPGEKGERVKLTEQQITRLESVAVSALKQCGRLYVPKIILRTPLSDWDSLPLPCFFGDVERGPPSLLSCIHSRKEWDEVFFVVGPESGFSDNEILCLKKGGAKGVSLHKNILRTDTAALAALAIISASR